MQAFCQLMKHVLGGVGGAGLVLLALPLVIHQRPDPIYWVYVALSLICLSALLALVYLMQQNNALKNELAKQDDASTDVEQTA